MDRWRGKVAVVTGASSGIGAAIAKALAHHGMVVVGMARREDRLKQLVEEVERSGEPGKMVPLRCDVSKEGEVVAAFEWVDKQLGGAEVLVNNAGVLNLSTMEDGTYEEWKHIIDVNLLGAMTCTREYLKYMKKHNKDTGHIFVINSVVGKLTTLPVGSVYTASKHALLALTQCLRKSLAERESKIKITDICPGSTVTEILDNCETPEMKGYFDRIPSMAPEDVATALIAALSASPVTQICEIVMTSIPKTTPVY